MLRKKLVIWEVLVILLILGAPGVASGEAAQPQRPHFQQAPLTLTRADGTRLSFTAEVARSPQEQEYGLMFLSYLPKESGMIFPYYPARQVAFWMKNTLIPLDMLFVGSGGIITHIIAQAHPLDLTPLYSQTPVVAVIEINGGQAKQDGIEVGNKVESPSIQGE